MNCSFTNIQPLTGSPVTHPPDIAWKAAAVWVLICEFQLPNSKESQALSSERFHKMISKHLDEP